MKTQPNHSPLTKTFQVSETWKVCKWLTMVLLLVGLLLSSVSTALAQDEISDDQVNAIAKDLFCPVCENTPLDVCPTQACEEWRGQIRQQLSEGQSPEDIKAYFAFQYGDHVLAEPPRRGFDLVVWILPIATVAAGGAYFFRYLQKLNQPKPRPLQTTPVQAAPTPTQQPTNSLDSYIAQIEQELNNHDG